MPNSTPTASPCLDDDALFPPPPQILSVTVLSALVSFYPNSGTLECLDIDMLISSGIGSNFFIPQKWCGYQWVPLYFQPFYPSSHCHFVTFQGPEAITQIRGLFAQIPSRLDPLKVLGKASEIPWWVLHCLRLFLCWSWRHSVAFQLLEETITIRSLVLGIWNLYWGYKEG